MKLLLIGAFAIAFVSASPVAARSLDKPPTKLDPAKAYVLVEIGNIDDGKFKGQLTLARYDMAQGDIAWLDKSAKKPALAHESTGKPLVRDKVRRLHLLELSPGLWVVEGANETAFSLGSQTFELAAGTLTDLGVAAVTTDYAEGETAYKMTAGKALKIGLLGAFAGDAMPQPIPKAVTFRVRTASDLAIPRTALGEARPVTWSGEVKFGNYLGGLVNRMGGRKNRPGADVTNPARAALTTQSAKEPTP